MAGLLLLVSLARCSGPPPPPIPPTVINANFTATADVNSGAPVAIRIYQLESSVGFKGANFFPIFEKDAATLKDDLVKREEFLLAPGQSKTVTFTPEDRARALGIFAAYRDYQHVVWRAAVDLPLHQTSTLKVTAAGNGVDASIEPDKPSPKTADKATP